MAPSASQVIVTELRRHFVQMLAEVQSGRSFIITRRGRPVVLLVPVEQDSRIG